MWRKKPAKEEEMKREEKQVLEVEERMVGEEAAQRDLMNRAFR